MDKINEQMENCDDFEWDEAKNASNTQKHQVSFELAAKFLIHGKWFTTRQPHEEEDRYKCIAEFEGRYFVIIITFRQKNCRIISARKANKRERNHYEEITSQQPPADPASHPGRVGSD